MWNRGKYEYSVEGRKGCRNVGLWKKKVDTMAYKFVEENKRETRKITVLFLLKNTANYGKWTNDGGYRKIWKWYGKSGNGTRRTISDNLCVLYANCETWSEIRWQRLIKLPKVWKSTFVKFASHDSCFIV